MSSTNEIQMERLLTDLEVAERLAVSVATARRWRLLRQGPRYLKVGASVRYRPQDVEAWIFSQPTGGAQMEVTQ